MTSSQNPFQSLDVLWKVITLFFRPRLQINLEGDRRREIVTVYYKADGSTGQATTGAGTIFSAVENTSANALYLRARVYNFGLLAAENCRVFVDKISFGEETLDQERSPLTWTDLDAFEHTLTRGCKNGKYIDICAADQKDSRLRILSQKAAKGYNKYERRGIYTLEISAESSWPCSNASLVLRVWYDGKTWDSLKVISQEPSCKWIRLW